jgi:import inner membrane translocase subunit TIM50
VDETVAKLDPNEMIIKHKLGREATFWEIGGYIKDLRYLNRNMKNIVCIDVDMKNVIRTPNNAIILPKFDGDVNDKELLQIVQFLKDLARPSVKDVRTEIEKYGNINPHIKYYKSVPKYQKLLPKEHREE